MIQVEIISRLLEKDQMVYTGCASPGVPLLRHITGLESRCTSGLNPPVWKPSLTWQRNRIALRKINTLIQMQIISDELQILFLPILDRDAVYCPKLVHCPKLQYIIHIVALDTVWFQSFPKDYLLSINKVNTHS